jgi:hypothetical protein
LLGDRIERRAEVGVVGGCGFHDLVGQQVGAGAFGGVVLSCGDEELARGAVVLGIRAAFVRCGGRLGFALGSAEQVA